MAQPFNDDNYYDAWPPTQAKGTTMFQKFQLSYAWDLHDFFTFFPRPEDTRHRHRFLRVFSPEFGLAGGTPFESKWRLIASKTRVNDEYDLGLYLEICEEVRPGIKPVQCTIKCVNPEGESLERISFNEMFDTRNGRGRFGFDCFKPLETIMDESYIYCPDGVLHILIDMTLCGEILNSHDDRLHNKDFAHTIRVRNTGEKHETVMLRLFTSGLMSDAVIAAGRSQTTFPVHVNILAAHSPVFQKLFETEMKEGITRLVAMPKFEPETVRVFLEFLYTGDMDMLVYNLMNDDSDLTLSTQLMDMAEMYLLKGLKDACFLFHVLNMKIETFGFVGITSHFHFLEEPKFRAEMSHYCRQNWLTLSRNKTFLKYYTKAQQLFDDLYRETELDGRGDEPPIIANRNPRLLAEFDLAISSSDDDDEDEDYEDNNGNRQQRVEPNINPNPQHDLNPNPNPEQDLNPNLNPNLNPEQHPNHNPNHEQQDPNHNPNPEPQDPNLDNFNFGQGNRNDENLDHIFGQRIHNPIPYHDLFRPKKLPFQVKVIIAAYFTGLALCALKSYIRS